MTALLHQESSTVSDVVSTTTASVLEVGQHQIIVADEMGVQFGVLYSRRCRRFPVVVVVVVVIIVVVSSMIRGLAHFFGRFSGWMICSLLLLR